MKISLIQKFGLKTELIKHIYFCHLINQKDGIFKRFGIDKLLKKIKNHFLNDKNNKENWKRFQEWVNQTRNWIF